VDVRTRSSPTVIALAFLACMLSLTRGSAFALGSGQDLSQAVASATRTAALTFMPTSSTPVAGHDSEPATLNWPQTSAWPLTFTGPVTLSGAPPQAVPLEPRETGDGHGFAKTVAGVSAGMFVLLQGVDIAQTMQCIGASSCREANPFLRSLARQPAAFGATKMAIAFVSGYALFHARARHPKLVTALSIAGIGLYATITYRQAQFNRR
jgi:hypothetical protein